MKAFFKEFFLTIALALIIFLVVNATLQTFVVIGSSMEPSFFDAERLLVNKAGYFFGDPERGDVIVFAPPGKTDSDDYIKRVIGLPGDKVMVREGEVHINGIAIKENYINEKPRYALTEVEVRDGYYFVLGDNRNNSNDSHTGWQVPRESIIGKSWLFIWPLDRLGAVPEPYPAEG